MRSIPRPGRQPPRMAWHPARRRGLNAEQDEVVARLVGPQRAQVVAHLEAVLGCAAR
ncbi:hypothetical protein [Plasticicumulans lactativorans]|uniref:hypothetical protein n=1 Tax=Plasticicumulans lactativorans TaxID=1133106 RepID=UPI0014052D9A|nr:hypothetical protein [Plasticicumulans lactativorans]